MGVTEKSYNSIPSLQGAALIMALFVVALVAAAATLMIQRLSTDIHRTELVLNADKAYFAAGGSVTWAIDTLNQNWKNQQNNQVIDRTPIRNTHKIDGMIISSVIYDAQGYFNINNLTDKNYQTFFLLLIQRTNPKLEANQAQTIALNTAHWITPGLQNNELDEYYLKFNPSYRVPHRPMTSISELRLVKNMTPAIFNSIAPYLMALPATTAININNVSAIVLMTTLLGLTPDVANTIIKALQKNPVANEAQLKSLNLFKDVQFDPKLFTFSSSYFLLETNVTVGEQHLTLYTLLSRVAKDKQSKVDIIWQSKGTL